MPHSSDQFDSPGVDVALAQALVGQAGANLSSAIERAVFIGRDELESWLHTIEEEGPSEALTALADTMRELLG